MTKTIFSKAAMVLPVLALLLSAPVEAKQNTDALKRLQAVQARLNSAVKEARNSPPAAYMQFCRKNARQCRGGGSSSVRYSKALMQKLYTANRDVNRKIRYRSDKGDHWTVPTRYGDCEDYALAKRAELIRKGVPAGALRMAVVKTRSGIGHAVLVVKTNRGDLVLDNRRSSIRTRQSSGYHYVKMATSNPRIWVSMLK